MFRAKNRRTATRYASLTIAAAASAVFLSAGQALAHVEVESEKAQALAENVEISFDAEAESTTAGITQIRVVLPEGIAPSDVTYGEGPKGWKFTTNDDGYTVKGPAVKAGENAEYSVVVRQLPDAEELAFKTLQTYSDGRTDRWIELGDGSEEPAPVLKLKAAAADAKPASPSHSETVSETPSESASPTAEESSASPTTEAKKDDDSGLSTGAWVGIGAAVLVALAAVGYAVRRRSGAQQ
ncbi:MULTISPECIES: DUF1775 domain-containing protein [unclassified Streptomyces]|uniref:DUF1775 domain-containing protein n=1 Tax=unclassified Streptomyces TaxID=2593676 RepID=UPI00225A623F|nr:MULTISPECIES: DUF1775 domain-containing protein [unclassified Streptomyces]MCX4990953.1 YcnI family protein [Streptomyces sp. NBC_00568]MCX5003816.1 YcnI family protein [Streptomyces sp. NBC_00638]